MDIDAVQQFVKLFPIDIETCTVIGIFIGLLLAIIKQHTTLSGQKIMIYAAVMAIVFQIALAIIGDASFESSRAWVTIIIASLVSWMVPVGGWSGVKQIAHKIGTPSTHSKS